MNDNILLPEAVNEIIFSGLNPNMHEPLSVPFWCFHIHELSGDF